MSKNEVSCRVSLIFIDDKRLSKSLKEYCGNWVLIIACWLSDHDAVARCLARTTRKGVKDNASSVCFILKSAVIVRSVETLSQCASNVMPVPMRIEVNGRCACGLNYSDMSS